MSEAQKTLEAIISEAMQPMVEQMNKAMVAIESGQKLMTAQSKVIEDMSGALIDIASFTAQAIKECDDPQVRHNLQMIATSLNNLIDKVQEV